MNKIQRELLLRTAQMFLMFLICWEVYWVLLYDTLYLRKPFYFFRYLPDWLIITLALIAIAVADVAIEHPEIFKRTKPKGSEPPKEKKKPKQKEKKRKPLW